MYRRFADLDYTVFCPLDCGSLGEEACGRGGIGKRSPVHKAWVENVVSPEFVDPAELQVLLCDF